MNKGDLFKLYLDGVAMTVCVLGFYNQENTGDKMVILAVISQENLIHVLLEDLEELFDQKGYIN